MIRASTSSPSVARLAQELADRDAGDAFVDELTGWLGSAPRFHAFAAVYRQKIRKKVRSASDAEALRDVRAELLAAFRFLVDKRFTVAYETYGSGRTGPDLTVAYRTSTRFNVEVTRMRKAPDPAAIGATLLAKLRQLPPSVPNVVLLAADRPALAIEVAGAVRLLRARADDRDDVFFERSSVDSARSFYERFPRLGAVISWYDEGSGDERAELWANPSARIPLPDRAARACQGCFQQGSWHHPGSLVAAGRGRSHD